MALEIKTKEDLLKVIEDQNNKIAELEETVSTMTQEPESTEEVTAENEDYSEEDLDELDKFLNE